MKLVNPATGELIRRLEPHDREQVETKLQMAERAFATWRSTTLDERSARLATMAEQLAARREPLARNMTAEMGKPLAAAEAEIDKCAWVCRYYAEHGGRFLAERPVETDAARSYVAYDPLGPVLAIMPWNFPFWQVYRFAAPAVMAGNAVVLKHASNVTGVALAIEELFTLAEFPAGLMSVLLVGSSEANDLIAHPVIRGVTLTGSDRAGRAVAQRAGQELKKAVLELGGSDPFLVLADADFQRAVGDAVSARTINSGQSCIAAKRFIVEEPLAEQFVDEMARRMNQLRVGDPLDRQTEVGPLAREDLLESLHGQVERSVAAGARLRAGGHRLNRAGFFYPPTVLDRVEPGMPAFDEETFGPVAAVTAARDREHAVELANASRYGLGASIYSSDVQAAEQTARQIEAGSVFINGIVKSDPRLPFGGVKQSGYGRELSEEGIREFVNVRTVWVEG